MLQDLGKASETKSLWYRTQANSLCYKTMQIRLTVLLLIAVLVFNGCTALEEAQRRREKRILEERNADSLMLRPSKATIEIGTDAIRSESDHYTLTFTEDLYGHPQFDNVQKREVFARSALGYMESLYDAMNRLFGFQTKASNSCEIA